MKLKQDTLYCFSPPVMLATFLIEMALAIFVFVKHRMTRFGQAAGATLICLAVFQLAEYRICTGDSGEPSGSWARVGFVAITILPVLGLYLVSLVSQRQHFLKVGYATAIGFVIYFMFVPKSITQAICGGNYVVFNMSNDLYRLYGFYYWGLLILGIWEAHEKIAGLKGQTRTRTLMQWLIIAYLSFMAPMGAAYVFFPETRNAVASIMCGFALALALILSLKIVPSYTRFHRRQHSS